MANRYKLPEDPRRRKQVKTFIKRYGREGYKTVAGRKGKPSPASFDSERGRRAALKMHALRRIREAEALEREKQENERQSTDQEN